MFVLVLAAGFSECADPMYDIQIDAERAAGMGVERCGGPTFDVPNSVLDQSCVDANIAAGTPYSAWASREDGSGTVYDGVIGYAVESQRHLWHIEDRRAVGGPLSVVRCVTGPEPSCEPRQCFADCGE